MGFLQKKDLNVNHQTHDIYGGPKNNIGFANSAIRGEGSIS